ncbi:MAG: TolC family protein [Gemmatimonadaceae bacterium]
MLSRGAPSAAIFSLIVLFAPASTVGAQDRPSSPAIADTVHLTLSAARALALRANPNLHAARMDTTVARGELQQASVLLRSNPSIEALAGGPGTEVGVSQEIEIAGQRGARRAAAFAGLDRSRSNVADTIRLTLGDVDRTFFRLAAANERAILAEEGRTLNERLANATLHQLQAGKISRLEYNLAAVELGRARARSLSTQREQARIAENLLVLLGLSPSEAVAPDIDKSPISELASSLTNLSLDSLTELALRRRPDLQALSAKATQSRALASTARREAFPNLSVRAASERIEGTAGRVLRPGVGLSIPIFNRNRGEIAAHIAEARKADLERIALAAEIKLEVARSLAAYRSARSETDILEQTVLSPARENRRLLEIAFREGKVGLPVVLLIRNQVIDAELDYWASWLAEREALTDLTVAIGGS